MMYTPQACSVVVGRLVFEDEELPHEPNHLTTGQETRRQLADNSSDIIGSAAAIFRHFLVIETFVDWWSITLCKRIKAFTEPKVLSPLA